MKLQGVLSRRGLLASGLVSAGGLLLPGCSRKVPPTYGSLLRVGDNFTYRAQRALLRGPSLAKEYARSEITSIPAIGCTDPAAAARSQAGKRWGELRAGGFAGYRLEVAGLVERPGSFSVVDLQRFPARTQITRHTCEEGWSAIGEWTGVPLHRLLETCGMSPAARFVTFHSFDDWADSIDLLDALHPQTLLAYGMNGRELPVPHGAPVRLRVERQLGYKSMKFVRRIEVTERLDDGGDQGNPKNGWAWYAGI